MKALHFISLFGPALAILYCFLLFNGIEGDEDSNSDILQRLQKIETEMSFLRNENEELHQRVQRQERDITRIKIQNREFSRRWYQIHSLAFQNQQPETNHKNVDDPFAYQENSTKKSTTDAQKDNQQGNTTTLDKAMSNAEKNEINRIVPSPTVDESESGLVQGYKSGEQEKTKIYQASFEPARLQTSRNIVSGRVGFSATLSDANGGDPTISGTIVFDNVLYSEGHAYNNADGIFAAPISGVYFFHWTVMSERSKDTLVDTELVVNGQVKTYAQETFGTASNLIIIKINAGDHVWIKTYLNQPYQFRCCATSFAGWLLYETN